MTLNYRLDLDGNTLLEIPISSIITSVAPYSSLLRILIFLYISKLLIHLILFVRLKLLIKRLIYIILIIRSKRSIFRKIISLLALNKYLKKSTYLPALSINIRPD